MKKIICLGVIFVMCLGLFAGCGGNKYNAEIYYNAQALMNDEYLKSNMTLGAYQQGSQIEDTSSPATRTYIIKDKKDFDLAFREFPEDIDFSKKMIIVYFFTSSYPTSPYKLKKINLSDGSLKIEFKLNKSSSPNQPNASTPQQTCIAVLIDRLDVADVVFKQI